MPISPKQKTEIRFDRLQQFFCALSNRLPVQQQPCDAANSSANKSTVIGRLEVADYVTLRAQSGRLL
jgi:hypothetical protein